MPALRTIKRLHNARTLHRWHFLADLRAEMGGWHELEGDADDPWKRPAATCEHCSGTGGDPWNEGITPCEHCDGEGYEWWN